MRHRTFNPRLTLALAALLLTTGCAAGCGSGGSATPLPSATIVPFASSAAIWFHPLPASATNYPGPLPNHGSSDFQQLFQPGAPWANVEAHTKVLGIYAGWVITASQSDLQQTIAFTNAHGMGLELEAPALQATATCGEGVEGFVGGGQTVQAVTLSYLQRLQSVGANLQYIKVDEPYFFGSVSTEPGTCQLPVSQVASEVSAYVQLVHTIYPNAAVGDVEPVTAGFYTPDVVTALGQWHSTYGTINGAPFPFYIADLDFNNATWQTLAKALEIQTKQAGMKFGIIYIGDYQDTSDQEWASKVVARFQTYQGRYGGQPDYVLFQSWEPHPVYCLPETNPDTFTGAINAYVTATSH